MYTLLLLILLFISHVSASPSRGGTGALYCITFDFPLSASYLRTVIDVCFGINLLVQKILASRATVKGYKLDALGQLSIGIKLLRLEAKGLLSGPRSRSYVSKYAFLPQLCGASGNIDPALLRAHVDGLFSAHGTPFPDIDDDTHLGG